MYLMWHFQVARCGSHHFCNPVSVNCTWQIDAHSIVNSKWLVVRIHVEGSNFAYIQFIKWKSASCDCLHLMLPQSELDNPIFAFEQSLLYAWVTTGNPQCSHVLFSQHQVISPSMKFQAISNGVQCQHSVFTTAFFYNLTDRMLQFVLLLPKQGFNLHS